MKVKRGISVGLVAAIAFTGIASLSAWLIKKNTQVNNSTNIENVLTGNGGMEIEDGQGSSIRMMSTTLKPKTNCWKNCGKKG